MNRNTPWPDPKYAVLTPEILAALSADDVAAAIVQHVELRLMSPGIDRDEIVNLLPPGTAAIYTTFLVDVEVNNGGFDRFFSNSHERLAGHALAGYELLGAEEYASVMRAAIATHETEPERSSPAYDEADQRYYSLGDRIYDSWAAFAHARPDLIIG